MFTTQLLLCAHDSQFYQVIISFSVIKQQSMMYSNFKVLFLHFDFYMQ